MDDDIKLIQVNVRLPTDLRKQLKLIALENDTSLQEVVTMILSENIERYK